MKRNIFCGRSDTGIHVNKQLYKCGETDPMRCHSDGPEGQCTWLSVAGMYRDNHIEDDPGQEHKYVHGTSCPRHGGWNQIHKSEQRRVHSYKLQHWRQRVDELSEGEDVKSLRGEIGVLRLCIETVLNNCHDEHDLVIFSTKIADLVTRCERLVRSCDRLEQNMNMMLDRATALAMGGAIVEIIAKEVQDADAVERISDQIITTIVDTTGAKINV